VQAIAELLAHLLGLIIGWPLAQFRKWADRQPDRDPSTMPWWHRLARLTLASSVCLMILVPVAWLIWR
jgi:hypothetical protein